MECMRLELWLHADIPAESGNTRRSSCGIPLKPIAVLLFIAACLPALAGGEKKALLFAAEMARDGNWREAAFRWERALAQDPDNPLIHNNLAVAMEVLGEQHKAGEYYARALELSPGDPAIMENTRHYRRFWNGGNAPGGHAATNPPSQRSGKNQIGKKKTFRVEARLPVPPRIDIAGYDSLLVASFLTTDSDLMDTSRELARYLRNEFRKKSSLDVRIVTPPPPIPEQRLEDLIANDEFWKHLGRTHDADIIVSGQVLYDRKDVSGFQDVDVVSPVTGHKVRQTRFVEQEEFEYAMTILFFDGRTGELLFQDQLKRSIFFRGLNNDPITAFYELTETLASDILSVVNPRRRTVSRIIFKG